MAYSVSIDAAETLPESLVAHLRREAPIHAFMLAVMVVTMVSGSAVLTVLGAIALVAASIVCAALSRAITYLREPVVDLWAMALVLLIYLPGASAAGSHSHMVSLPHALAFAVVATAWIVARLWLARGRAGWRLSLASAVLTAAGLTLMALLCS